MRLFVPVDTREQAQSRLDMFHLAGPPTPRQPHSCSTRNEPGPTVTDVFAEASGMRVRRRELDVTVSPARNAELRSQSSKGFRSLAAATECGNIPRICSMFSSTFQ